MKDFQRVLKETPARMQRGLSGLPYTLVLAFVLLAGLAGGCTRGQNGTDADGAPYKIESIQPPSGLVPETGGLDFMPDGRLVGIFHRGEVMTYDPETKEWSLFAKGLHDPLGVKATSDSSVLVTQRPELTRLTDTDGNGRADRYQTVTDDFGMSGNYHEFAFGPARDSSGALYISLNTASNGAGIWDELRGRFAPEGRPGRMYSPVPYRGWVLKVDPQTGRTTPFANGFRSPNGLCFGPEGRFFVTDNQGDWLGTSKLYHVEKDQFYGHVASLVWEEGFDGVQPLDLPVPVLNKMRRKAAVQFPQGILANSPTEPVVIPEDTFGPFGDQLLIGEMNHPRLLRVMLEEVRGQVQGAAIAFLDSSSAYRGEALRTGNNRLRFGPGGDLWVGQTDHGWPGDQGLQRISWNGRTPADVQDMRLTEEGFDLVFTRPLAEGVARADSAFQFTRYYYEYHRDYGSDQFDRQPVKVTGVEISEDRRRVSLRLAELVPGYIYQLQMNGLRTEGGTPLANENVYYTLNRLKEAPARELRNPVSYSRSDAASGSDAAFSRSGRNRGTTRN
jgi:glucose/arabinose dehydrogenase